MKRKIISMFAVLAVAVSMVGCAEQIYADVPVEDTGENISVVSQITDTTETNSTEIQYVTDWSIDEIIHNFELNGVSYSKLVHSFYNVKGILKSDQDCYKVSLITFSLSEALNS